jgi:hypothetical protein
MTKLTEAQERTWGMFCHLAALAGYIIPFGNIIGPLIIWLIKKDESDYCWIIDPYPGWRLPVDRYRNIQLGDDHHRHCKSKQWREIPLSTHIEAH